MMPQQQPTTESFIKITKCPGNIYDEEKKEWRPCGSTRTILKHLSELDAKEGKLKVQRFIALQCIVAQDPKAVLVASGQFSMPNIGTDVCLDCGTFYATELGRVIQTMEVKPQARPGAPFLHRG